MDLDIDKIAAEICYAGLPEGVNYGGAAYYWRGVVESRKEIYRIVARAAVAEIERQSKPAGDLLGDDIVSRLRREGQDAFHEHYSLGMWRLCSDAADEIENLRGKQS